MLRSMSARGSSNFCSGTKRVSINEPEKSYIAPGRCIQNTFPPSQFHCGKELSLIASTSAMSELSLVPSALAKSLSVSDSRLEHP